MPGMHYRLFVSVGLLLAINWLTLAFLDPDPPGSRFVMLGYFLGSLFAQTTLASAWMAFGLTRWWWRVPLSLGWLISLTVAVGINFACHGGPSDAVTMLGSCLLGQWLLLQLPFWTLALVSQVRLRQLDDVRESDTGRVRFGIRHLLIVMTIAGVVLGTGRIVVSQLSLRGEGPIFVFLAVAAIVLTLPLLLASLLRRRAILGTALALLVTGLATVWELPLLQALGTSRPGPQTGHFIAINVTSSLLILVVAGVVRMNGYCLCAQPAAAKSLAD